MHDFAGDVAGVIAVTDPDTTIDLYMGQGGAPEGVEDMFGWDRWKST